MDIAQLFKIGRFQAVRLPAAYRFEGSAVRVSRRGRAVILEPLTLEPEAWFADIDACAGGDFFASGREQPKMPELKVF